ncbi:membrane protein [Alkalicella caledoniensis]|uniref:Membrane protein n=1 Tax=Alkalicella caledoniensis TaxID=2731377 RepID=A0A7G9W6D9_ALKCA|nr:hypothetical protein [Alkalicella caledoniensis]QNO14251.1 membrane protein [Alkalicella caledoniensis]
MKRWLFYFTGLCIAALGISSIITSDMGAGSWDTVFVGLSNTIGLTPGNWLIVGGGLLVFLNSFISKDRPDFTGFITVLITGILIDLNLKFLELIPLQNVYSRILLFSIGFLLLITGAGTYLQAKFAANPIDNLMLVVHKRFGFSIAVSRLICETSALIMGLLLSGPVSYGTVVIAIFIGPSIQFTYKVMDKIYHKSSNQTLKKAA